ncbi:hypothetical protein BH11ACT6_BH11ACT6_57860 [soil metagenome]
MTPENSPEFDASTTDTTEDATAVPSTTDTDPVADTDTAEVSDVTETESAATEPDETGTEIAATEAVGAESVPAESVAENKPGTNWPRVLAFGILPVLALILGAAAGYLKWQDSSVRNADIVRIESVQVAKDATVRLLSYKPDTVDQDLGSARELLTGEFRDSYTQLINDVVIPGSKEKQISAVATVPAAASVSAEPNKAVVLVFVNQTVMVGTDAPTATTSSVQVTMERAGDGWLISEFDPV